MVVCMMCFVSPGYAGVVNIDVSGNSGWGDPHTPYTGVAAAADAGTYWNYQVIQSNPTMSGLVMSDGVTSAGSIAWTLSNPGGMRDYGGNGYQIAGNMMDSFVYAPGVGDFSFGFTGLDAGQQYDLYLYATNGVYATQGGSFTINGITKIAAPTGQIDALIEGVNYVKFSLAADAMGVISGTAINASSIAGVQLQTVPEPGVLMCLAAGLASLPAYSWRKRK